MNERKEIRRLAERMADGTADSDHAARLSQLLRQDGPLREEYLAYLDTHAALSWEFRNQAAMTKDPRLASPTIVTGRLKAVAWLPWTLTAAALVLAIVAWWRAGGKPDKELLPIAASDGRQQDRSNRDRFVALLVDEAGARFAPGRAPDGVRVGPGEYELLQGLAHFRFAHGADVVLAGPARLSVTDVSHARLSSGSVRVIAPPTAAGFTITTPAADYVDLGTEFGLRVEPSDGTSDLYVFDGQVNITDSRSGQVLSEVFEGSSSRFLQGVPAAAPKFKDSDFPNPGTIGLARWQEYARQMAADPGLLAFFAFRRTDEPSVLVNSHENHIVADGRIVGARWAGGRWPGKDSLLFDQAGDGVQLDIPGQFAALTVAAWLRLDRLDCELNAIFNSDGSPDSGVHFQLTRQGLPRGGVLGVKCLDAYVGGPVPIGKWTHVAMVIATADRSQKIYVNGKLARHRTLPGDVIVRPGSVRLGDWLAVENKLKPSRTLRGRIDELVLWSRAVSEEEIVRLVEVGRPGLLWEEKSFNQAAGR